MRTVAQIPQDKPDQAVHTMAPSASAHEGARLMAEEHRRAGGGP